MKVNGKKVDSDTVDKGSRIWEDKNYTISYLPQELKGAAIFRTNYMGTVTNIIIDSNKDAKVYIALSDSNNDKVTQDLQKGGWTLRHNLYLEYKGEETAEKRLVKTKKLGKVFSKEIKVEDDFTLTLKIVEFALLIVEGKFC